MTKATNTRPIEEIERLFRPSGALLAAGSNLGGAIEYLAVAKTRHSSAILDLLVRLRFAPDGQLRGVDLVNQLHMSPGYVSRLIDQAEAEGLISRKTDPRDRRAQLIELTPPGERAFDEFVPPVQGGCHTMDAANERTGTTSDHPVTNLQAEAPMSRVTYPPERRSIRYIPPNTRVRTTHRGTT